MVFKYKEDGTGLGTMVRGLGAKAEKDRIFLLGWGEVLSQLEELKYLRVDRSSGCTNVDFVELSQKARLSVYRSVFLPTVNDDHELWMMIEKMRNYRNEFPVKGGWTLS